MDLSHEHIDLLLHVAKDASLGNTFSERMDAVSGSVLAMVPGSSSSMIVLDPIREGSPVHAFIKNNDPEGARQYASHYAADDPLPGQLMRTPGRPMRLSDTVTPAAWGRDSYTGEFLVRHGIRHFVGFIQPLPDGRVLQVGIHRERGLSDFNSQELELLQLASFDLGRSAFGVLVREQLARSQSVLDDEAKVGVLLFNTQGYVEEADGGARAIVRRLKSDFPMEELLCDIQVARSMGGSLQRSVRVGDGVLLVRVSPLEQSPKSSVLVVMELRSSEPRLDFAARVAHYGLTPRERDVVAVAVLGLTNLQIAEELSIRPATVSVHLTHAFRKVGVTSRTELTRLLTGPAP